MYQNRFVELSILPILHFSVQYVKYFMCLCRNNLAAKNQGEVETPLSTGQSAYHNAPPAWRLLSDALGQKDGSAFMTSWNLSYRELLQKLKKKKKNGALNKSSDREKKKRIFDNHMK